jgi:hypothetical protein
VGRGLSLALGVILFSPACGPRPATAPGQPLDLSGAPVDPFKSDARAVVLVFTATDCPISNRYAPEIERIHRRFAAKKVSFWLVYPNPGESVEAIRAHVGDFGYGFGVLRDPEHSLVKRTGVRVTPEAAVFVSERALVYRGRIDDLYLDFGRTRSAATTHDLADALEAALEGKPVRNERTTAVGCYIPEL